MGNQLKAGDVVTYNGWTEEQVKWGNNDTPYMLIVGRQYVVESVEVHKWHTKVSLHRVQGKFNSVHFSLNISL